MKILGYTATGYLVDMGEDEVALAMGFVRADYDPEWKTFTSPLRETYSGGKLKLGASLLAKTARDEMGRIMRGADELKKAAEMLRGLASLIEQGPATLIALPAAPRGAPTKIAEATGEN